MTHLEEKLFNTETKLVHLKFLKSVIFLYLSFSFTIIIAIKQMKSIGLDAVVNTKGRRRLDFSYL